LIDIHIFDGENFDGVVDDRDIGVRKFYIDGKDDAEIIRRGAGIVLISGNRDGSSYIGRKRDGNGRRTGLTFADGGNGVENMVFSGRIFF